jgi:uncharacterized OB-fold protein
MTVHEDAKGRPLPEITDLTRPFWTAAKNGELVMQRCKRCETLNFLPKPWCVECGGRELHWVVVSGKGTVYSFTVSYRVMMNFPGWSDDLPVVTCIIDLDEGARMYGQLIDCEPDDVRIGMKVGVCFEEISPEAAIPKFRPVRPA